MQFALIDKTSLALIGLANAGFPVNEQQFLMPVPPEFSVDELDLWIYDGEKLVKGVYVPPIDPTAFLVDTGPFFDRFGTSKLPILMSADPLVKALMADIQVRKWIDLQRLDVAQALEVLISKSLITNELKMAILNTPVATEENRVLKKLYFS